MFFTPLHVRYLTNPAGKRDTPSVIPESGQLRRSSSSYRIVNLHTECHSAMNVWHAHNHENYEMRS